MDLRAARNGVIRELAENDAALSTPRDINELVNLGEIGHVRKIQEKLAGIEREAPEYARFVNQMRAFVNAFDLKRYLAALEDYPQRQCVRRKEISSLSSMTRPTR